MIFQKFQFINRVNFRTGWQEVKRSIMHFSIPLCQQIHRYASILSLSVNMLHVMSIAKLFDIQFVGLNAGDVLLE